MARPREPIDLVVAKGKKHLSKEEIEERRASEPKPHKDDITPPKFLTSTQKKHFTKLAGQLDKIGIMGETDTEILARYVVVEGLYEEAVKAERAHRKTKPKTDAPDYLGKMIEWLDVEERYSKLIDRYFKQATAAARELGLTISSRCKIQVPVKEDEPVTNKFAKFGGAG